MKKVNIARLTSLFIAIAVAVSMLSLAGCGTKTSQPSEQSTTASETAKAQDTAAEAAGEPVELSLLLINEDFEFFNKGVQEESFKKMLPNVTLDIQQVKDSTEQTRVQMVRQAANEMPDVFYVKPFDMNALSKAVLPWSKEDELIKSCKFIDTFDANKIEGGYFGIPYKYFTEWVYYKKSIFKELNLEVPTTWDAFIETARKIKESGKYIPLTIGAKDSWMVYPYLEFGPHLLSGDKQLLTSMTKQDEPFVKDSGFYKACEEFEKIAKAEITGKALGTSWAEVQQLMASNKAAMAAVGQYFLPLYLEAKGDPEDIDVFPMPLAKNGDKTVVMGMVDMHLAVSKNSKYPEEAKNLVKWFFSKDVYPKFLAEKTVNSTIDGIDVDNIFTQASKKYSLEIMPYIPGDDNYTKLKGETKYDYMVIGTYMLAGKDFRPQLDDLNKKWKAAREKLGIN